MDFVILLLLYIEIEINEQYQIVNYLSLRYMLFIVLFSMLIRRYYYYVLYILNEWVFYCLLYFFCCFWFENSLMLYYYKIIKELRLKIFGCQR